MNQLEMTKQEQLLKLVTKGFFNELQKLGVSKNDLVYVTVYLMDHIMQKDDHFNDDEDYYNSIFKISGIKTKADSIDSYYYDDISILPIKTKQISLLSEWLSADHLEHTLIDLLPVEKDKLIQYMLGQMDKKYFAIFESDIFVGIIGAENIDQKNSKLEMKKYVHSSFSGKGIGKKATLLFLYHVFSKLSFNKVYIYTLDTNLRNININKKFGFELTGIHFQDIKLDDKFIDVVKMSLLKSRWQKIFIR